MKLSAKSSEFVAKILKYHPIPGTSQKQSDAQQKQNEKPYLHLHDHRKERQIYERPTDQKLSNMQFFKEQGNNHYKNNRFNEAAYFYQKAIIYGDYTFPDNPNDQSRMENLLQISNCNMALCLIKKNEETSEGLKKIKMHLSEGLKGKNVNIQKKSNYWMAKLCIKEGDITSAQKFIDKLKEIENEPSDILKEINELLLAEQIKIKGSNKEVFSKMFQ